MWLFGGIITLSKFCVNIVRQCQQRKFLCASCSRHDCRYSSSASASTSAMCFDWIFLR